MWPGIGRWALRECWPHLGPDVYITSSSRACAEARGGSHRNPEEIPWGANGVDIVVESTGVFTSIEKVSRSPAATTPQRASSQTGRGT